MINTDRTNRSVKNGWGGTARTIWVLVQYSRNQYPTVAYVVLFLCSPGQAGRLQTTWPGIFLEKRAAGRMSLLTW